jgi:hypothetical protein
MLRRAFRHAMIYFRFIFISVLRRMSSRVTFHIKFSLDDVCRRATLDVMFIIIQVSRGALRRATSHLILNSV